jgi:hypothetical protein
MSPTLSLPPVVARWYEMDATLRAPGCWTWISRGANFVVALSKLDDGAELVRGDNPDEYVVLNDDVAATFSTPDETICAARGSLTIVPPGKSRVVARGRGTVICIFSSNAQDVLEAASNADDYARGAPLVAPLVSWPEPPGGYRLRSYELADHRVHGSIMRIFRTRNLMVNVLMPWTTPRDIHRLSPHSHADFEQGSLALESEWTHHLRFPWTPDMSTWRDDQHVEIGYPSLTIIPPTVIHTSRNRTPNGRLVDIFAPPRVDFSRTSGLVINAADYPMPSEAIL